MVENYLKNVTKEVSRAYLDGIERIEDQEHRASIQGFLLKAAADHLNKIGYKYSTVETEEGEIISVKPESDRDEGDTLTLGGLRELAEN